MTVQYLAQVPDTMRNYIIRYRHISLVAMISRKKGGRNKKNNTTLSRPESSHQTWGNLIVFSDMLVLMAFL